jgi:hypothetical protein
VHFADYLSDLETFAAPAQSSFDDLVVPRCLQCHKEVLDSQHQFFVTVYSHGQERADFWAPLHDQCAELARVRWCLPLQ